MASEQIPDIIIGRLPRYLQVLTRMFAEGSQTTSSQDLGLRIGISAAQIRKDLSQFGEFGKQGTGYAIPYLIDQLQSILNVKKVWKIALVGAGDLGHAIARYQGFANRGFQVALVFDNDGKKIGQKIGGLTIQNIEDLVPAIKASGIVIAMLTVSAKSAQIVAEKLVEAGVLAILSYAPVPLILPPGIYIEYIDPIIQLQHMTYYLENR